MSGTGPWTPEWRKSSFSANGDCVEVAVKGGTVLVRDSRRREETTISFQSAAWQEFIQAIR